jgi:hypothetical protein
MPSGIRPTSASTSSIRSPSPPNWLTFLFLVLSRISPLTQQAASPPPFDVASPSPPGCVLPRCLPRLQAKLLLPRRRAAHAPPFLIVRLRARSSSSSWLATLFVFLASGGPLRLPHGRQPWLSSSRPARGPARDPCLLLPLCR